MSGIRCPVHDNELEAGECSACETWGAKEREIANFRARIAAAEAENECDACGGSGIPVSGPPCMCGGTGRMSEAARNLRQELIDLRTKLAAADAEITRLRLAIEAHQLQSVGWRETTVVDRELWAAGVEVES